MYVRSTGLGRTLLKARIGKLGVTHVVPSTLEESKDEPPRMIMVMEIQEPVHWEVKAFMDPQDIRRLLLLVLKPSTIFYGLKLLFSKSRATNLETQKVSAASTAPEAKKATPQKRAGERPRANVPLSPAQKAALKKKEREKQRKALRRGSVEPVNAGA
jgi:hypothetical protein